MLGGFQTLVAGITALVTGTLYEHAGRTIAYGVSAGLMVLLVAVGVILAGPAWRLRGAPVPAESVAGHHLSPADVASVPRDGGEDALGTEALHELRFVGVGRGGPHGLVEEVGVVDRRGSATRRRGRRRG